MTSMWENLPSHLRTGLAVALLLVVGVAAASFTLSFIALREVAANPITGWGANAWIFPLCVDAALVAAEVAYISVSMIRGVNRALPFSLVVLFGTATVWFNIERVPASWRMVTAIPPVAGVLMTLLIAYLLKVFARVTGRTLSWDAPPPPAGYGAITDHGPVQGAILRPGADGWPPHPVYAGTPSVTTSGTPQNGRRELDEASKRTAVEMYLSGLDSEQLGVTTGSSIVKAMAGQGIELAERHARRILEEWRHDHTARKGRRP